jgi:hypothetical protein
VTLRGWHRSPIVEMHGTGDEEGGECLSVWALLPSFRGPAAGARAIATVIKRSSAGRRAGDSVVAKPIVRFESDSRQKDVMSRVA